MRLTMYPYNIFIKCYKKCNDGSLAIYFETHSRLVSGLLLYDVYTLTREHYKEILSSSNLPLVLKVRVDSKKDYILGQTKINF